MIAGALSMGVGEYVSVSSQRDSERAELDLERQELRADPEAELAQLTNPWHAAWASMAAFVTGALIPLLTILLSPAELAVPLTALAVVIALAATGSISARLGRAPQLRAMMRTVGGGMLAMAVTYGIGLMIGAQI